MVDGGGGFNAGRGWARLGAVGQHWPGSGGAHVVSWGAKRREGSDMRERKAGAGRLTGGTVPGVGLACQQKKVRERRV
jgi:hypothetical protein